MARAKKAAANLSTQPDVVTALPTADEVARAKGRRPAVTLLSDLTDPVPDDDLINPFTSPKARFAQTLKRQGREMGLPKPGGYQVTAATPYAY